MEAQVDQRLRRGLLRRTRGLGPFSVSARQHLGPERGHVAAVKDVGDGGDQSLVAGRLVFEVAGELLCCHRQSIAHNAQVFKGGMMVDPNEAATDSAEATSACLNQGL